MTSGDLLATWLAEEEEGTISSARRRAAWLGRTLDLHMQPGDDSRWMRDVSRLGYVEADWERDRWTAAPLVITRLPASDGLAVVTGRLTAEIRLQMTGLAPEVHFCSQPKLPKQLPRPRAVLMQYESVSDLRKAANELGAQYVPCAATQLAAILRSPALGPGTVPPRDRNDTLEFFQPEALSWRSAERLRRDSFGLYRFDVHNRKRHLWFGPDGWHDCGLAAGTHIALAAQGCSSLQWRGSRDGLAAGEVICDTRAPLPALYERTLVLCSGLLPTVSAHAPTAIYCNIPPSVAHAVAANLEQSLDPIREGSRD